MIKIPVLDEYDTRIRFMAQEHPEFNGTQLAIWLAGGYGNYPEYIKYIQAYNRLKSEA
jgi:hypothetical protein